MKKLYSRQAIKAEKNDDEREITQRQNEVELQFLYTRLSNIATYTHTIFQAIPIYDDKVIPWRSKKCNKTED